MGKSLASLNVILGADTSKFEKKMRGLERSLGSLERKFKTLGKDLTTNVTLPIIGFGAAAVASFSQIEKMQVALKTAFQGNEKAAAAAFKEIQKFASETPFQMSEVLDAFIKLKNYGLDPSREALEAYGNIAGAMGKSLNDVIEAVADASTAEFERLKEFGIRAKKQGDEVAFTFQGITTTVKNNAKDIQGYLQSIGNVNFAGGMKAQSTTLLGVISTMKDSVMVAMSEMGSSIVKALDLKEVAKNFSKKIAEITSVFSSMTEESKATVVQIGLFVAAAGPAIFLVGKMIGAYKGLVTVYKNVALAMTMANLQMVAITAAAAALVAAAIYIEYNWDAFVKHWGNVWKELVWSANEGVNKMLRKIKEIPGVGDLFDFGDIAPIPPPKLDWPKWKSFGEVVKEFGKELAESVGIQFKKDGSDQADYLRAIDEEMERIRKKNEGNKKGNKGTSSGGGGTSGGGGGGSWQGAAQDNLEKIKAGYEGVTMAVRGTGVAVQEMTMNMVEGTGAALSALESMSLGLADSLSNMAESGATSMSDLSRAVVSEIRKMIVAKIKLGVASAIGEKMAAGPFGIFLAAGAGLAASAIFSRILGSLKVPALAQGGAAFGPTLAMVGDNPNASRDPELIMPFSKMRHMILQDIVPSMRGNDYAGVQRLELAPQEIRVRPTSINIEGRMLRVLLEQENNYARGLR